MTFFQRSRKACSPPDDVVFRTGQKPFAIHAFRRPVLRKYHCAPCLWPESILFGHVGTIITLNGFGVRESLAIVPWHPLRRAGGQFPGMPLQLDQVVEGVDAA